MKTNAMKTSEGGQVYEELDGERVSGDGEGDQAFILSECLTPAELERLLDDKLDKNDSPRRS